MEIKTCEEYVLNELNATQNKLVETQMELGEVKCTLNNVMSNFNDLKNIIKTIIEYCGNDGGESYIQFQRWVWETDPMFDRLVELIPGINKPKI